MRTHLLNPWLSLVLLFGAAHAQPPIAPTPIEPNPKGERTGDYVLSQSFELGYRFADINGNREKYRSDVNFRNGLRLLSSSLDLHSRDAKNRIIDELRIHTQGLGNDPYQFASVTARKNKAYQYLLTWRENAYFNPALTISNGQHRIDTVHRLQDHELTLFPGSSFRLIGGYSRNAQNGPALSTLNINAHSGDEFALFTPIARTQDLYRFGAQLTLGGWALHLRREWDEYSERILQDLTSGTGNNAADSTVLQRLTALEPIRGSAPSWQGMLFRESKWYAVNGRFGHVSGRRNFVLDESLVGTDRFGIFNRQLAVSGNARRPVSVGNLNLSLMPSDRLTLTNHFSFHQTRMDGDSTYREISNINGDFTELRFQYLGIRLFSNETQASYRLTRSTKVYGGYQTAGRRIRSVEATEFFGVPDRSEATQENRQHAGLAGFVWQTRRGFTLQASGELGRNSRPFYPVSDRDYHALQARAQYRTQLWRAALQYRNNFNFNGIGLANFAARTQALSADFQYTPRTGPFSLEASFARLKIRSLGAIAYFANNRLVSGDRSLYLSDLYTGSLGIRTAFRKRADLYVGYTRVQDVGDRRSNATGSAGYSALPALLQAQVFRVTFQSPMARLSITVTPKLRWNAGYQFYGYGEQFANRQNYRANTGFTSITWSF